jgi:hypothetical protein
MAQLALKQFELAEKSFRKALDHIKNPTDIARTEILASLGEALQHCGSVCVLMRETIQFLPNSFYRLLISLRSLILIK